MKRLLGLVLLLPLVGGTPPPPQALGFTDPMSRQAFEAPPRLIHLEAPEYPQLALEAGIGGAVAVKVHVGTDGRVVSSAIVRSEVTPAMEKSALAAAMQCRFQPARRGSTPVDTYVVIPFYFRLPERARQVPVCLCRCGGRSLVSKEPDIREPPETQNGLSANDRARDAHQAPTPHRLVLRQNAPNPFNPATTIRFELAQDDIVRLDVFSVRGKRVKTLVLGRLQGGPHNVTWAGKDVLGNAVGSGVYLYRLQVGSKTLSKKMVLLK
ncbi:MAG: TonB family protein [Candidatus Krumholzibacteria bacterium]|nr:TonB family protein [Candidatus Krumholzibacteria bacterium]